MGADPGLWQAARRRLGQLAKSTFLRSVAWESSGTIGTALVGIGITVVLARLLEPANFGTVGMAMAFVALSEIFLDGGFSSIIIQAPAISQVALNTIFRINLVLGALLTLAFFLGAPVIGSYYGSDEVVSVTRVLAFTFLVWSLSSVQTSLLRKKLQYRVLSSATILGLGVGGGAAIIVVLSGGGIWGLVTQIYVVQSIRLAWIWRCSDWRPGLAVSLAEVAGHAQFGCFVFLSGLVNRFFAHFDSLVLGRAFDGALLGQFHRSKSFLQMTYKFSTKPVANVFFPYVSKHQANPELLAKRVTHTLRYFGMILGPVAALLFLNASWIIPTLFGDQWHDAVPLLQMLVFSLHVAPVGAITGAILTGTGAGGRVLSLELVKKVVFVTLQLVGLWRAGLQGYLFCLVLAGNLTLLLDVLALRRTLPLSALRMLREIFGWPLLSVGLVAASYGGMSLFFAPPSYLITVGYLLLYGAVALPFVADSVKQRRRSDGGRQA